ncbi:MAG: HDOD domain-containing protein [Gammaproteobacteria bacterium]|nr:HDOD domain-containing protein [Gammaproteobacteria bacterium]MCW9003810.1 HDOD domain-containing protein [Gammaproteobacteria bacterium]MCW9055409.1 HDOD domain-containing protein [Gammaproteobacteria bacterium]
MPPVQNDAQLPPYIGRFHILNKLGKGSQGIVYLATDPQLERNVAIKTIELEKPTPRVKEQLLKEAKTVGKLQHPNIITLYEADQHRDIPYLVFEYVDGFSLKDYLKREGKLSSKKAINIISPVLNAIGYAHKRGVIHRDLNPDNIILTSDNNKPRLMDFGISTLLGNKAEDGIWGTLNYLSPEQCEGQQATAASDTFSIGLILYEMLTGEKAAPGGDKYAVINKIVNEEIKMPSDVDPAIQLVLQKALQKEPEARYMDALDMRQDLLNHLKQIAPDTPSHSPAGSEATSNTTLQFLLRRMELKSDFPTLSHQIIEISQKCKADGESSANALSNAILKDYSLSTKLLRLVNSPLYGQYGGKISTISRAVVILGFEEVRNAALGLMLLDHLKDKNQAGSLKEACIGSLMSGSIANGLSKDLKIKDSEEAYVCSMFHNLGKMLAIYYFPEEVEVILDHVQQKGMKEDHAAQSVLGVTFEEVGIAVGESWQLPSEIIESMQPLPPGELKKPVSQIDMLKHMSGFSNEYCDLISSTSASNRNEAFETIASRYGNTLSISRGQMEDIVSHAMDEMAKYAKLVNLDLGESKLFTNAAKWSSRAVEEAIEDAENDTPSSTESMADELARQEQLVNAMQEITEAILEGAPLNNILVMIMETIFTGLNFTRVTFCFINKTRTAIDARFGFGPDIEAIKDRLSIPTGGDKDIFNQALKLNQDMRIENMQSVEAQSLMPKWYIEKFAKKSMLVFPITVKNIPMGILFIDNINPISMIDEKKLNMARTLRNQIVLAIRNATS